MKEQLKEIIEHYGIDKQLKYIHSEYFELDEAILQYEHINDYDKTSSNFKTYGNNMILEHIAEELADVMCMIKQFQYYYGITDEQIEDIMKFKIDRQLERIKKENNLTIEQLTGIAND